MRHSACFRKSCEIFLSAILRCWLVRAASWACLTLLDGAAVVLLPLLRRQQRRGCVAVPLWIGVPQLGEMLLPMQLFESSLERAGG